MTEGYNRVTMQPIQGDEHWFAVKACPSCGEVQKARSGRLQSRLYRMGDEEIQIPARGIALIECPHCGLFYKDTLPSPKFLAEVFTRQAGKIWTRGHDFAGEARLLCQLTGGKSFDVLDIGASNGDLLMSLAKAGVNGRRSALDVIPHPGIEQWVTGEFVSGLVDAEDLFWSTKPYDVITMFDVVEHLYAPNRAFSNLRRLMKPGGVAVIETGDAYSSWPKRFGPHRWWYASLFEHHIIWSERALEYAASRHGLRVLKVWKRRHKSRSTISYKRAALLAAKTALYHVTPKGYAVLAHGLGEAQMQPWSPFTSDHLRMILRNEASE